MDRPSSVGDKEEYLLHFESLTSEDGPQPRCCPQLCLGGLERREDDERHPEDREGEKVSKSSYEAIFALN